MVVLSVGLSPNKDAHAESGQKLVRLLGTALVTIHFRIRSEYELLEFSSAGIALVFEDRHDLT